MNRSRALLPLILFLFALPACGVGEACRDAAGCVVLGAYLLLPAGSYWAHESTVATNYDGGWHEQVRLSVCFVPRDEVPAGTLEPDEVLVAFTCDEIGRGLLLVAVRGLPASAADLKKPGLTAETPASLRGWLILQGPDWKLAEGVAQCPQTGILRGIPASFPVDALTVTTGDPKRKLGSESRLWAEWWKVAGAGACAQHGSAAAPISGRIRFAPGHDGLPLIELDVEAQVDGETRYYRGKLDVVKRRYEKILL
jgi:hypothetical protein